MTNDRDRRFVRRLLSWQARHGRHDLPWMHPRTPYRVWISEIMLQQTRVEAVTGYFERFIQRFPDVDTLAAAPLDDVLAAWSGLGYYARARNLHRAASIICSEHGREMPRSGQALEALPGVGRSTAGAILSLGHEQPAAILDGNARRVLARFHGLQEDPRASAGQRRLWQWAVEKLVHLQPGDAPSYSQALMDLGATVCLPRAPRCPDCPLRNDCAARTGNRVGEIPAARKMPRKLPVRATRMYLLLDPDRRILLEKRPGTGVWGGLWSLPEMCGECGPEVPWPPLRHTFTHFHLDISPVEKHLSRKPAAVREPGRAAWYTIGEARQLGIPAPVRRLLDQLDEKLKVAHEPHGILPQAG